MSKFVLLDDSSLKDEFDFVSMKSVARNENCPVFIPVKAEDAEKSLFTIQLIRENIRPQSITLVTAPSRMGSSHLPKEVQVWNEDGVVEELSFKAVRKMICSLGGDPKTTGWYLQQFLKLGLARSVENDYYITCDADTLPLRFCNFFDEDGRPYFTLKREYHARYFKTLYFLLGMKKCIPPSFISEQMVFKTSIVREMLDDIESLSHIPGDFFWQKILYVSVQVEFTFSSNVFSEFETYGTYVFNKYPLLYKYRTLNSLRCAALYFGRCMDAKTLEWMSQSINNASFEELEDPRGKYKLISKIVHLLRFMPADRAVLLVRNLFLALGRLPISKLRQLRRRIEERSEFDYLFSDKCNYQADSDGLKQKRGIKNDLH